MQHGEGRERKAAKRGCVVEIGDHRNDAVGAQAWDFLCAAHDADDPGPGAHHLRGAQAHVTAADQENPDQLNEARARERERNLRR